MMTMNKCYSELITIPDFDDRIRYLMTNSAIGEETFGDSRWLNQVLYHSREWLSFKNDMIIRDGGCDLAMPGHEVSGYKDHNGVYHPAVLFLHHINPITKEDVLNRDFKLFDPENVVCTIHDTHNKIHYGLESSMLPPLGIRKPNDTCPWKK